MPGLQRFTKSCRAKGKKCAAGGEPETLSWTGHFHAMSVIPLTVFFSLLLAGTFVLLFAREQRRRHLTSPERESLLPLADETGIPVVVRVSARAPSNACTCQGAARLPCACCLRRRDEIDPAHF